jgi:hypothetical protein
MILTHDLGLSISLGQSTHAAPLWTYRYGGTPKPHMASLRTPSGHELALLEPVDHAWHRGLWFTIKFVNGVNFWEERDPFGLQRTVGTPQVEAADDRVTISTRLDWVAPDGSTPIREDRTISYMLGDSAYLLDWTSTITATTDVELDRTPYTTWGGYGGLSFRGTRLWHLERYLTPDGAFSPYPAGQDAPWVDLSGTFDGEGSPTGGIAIIERGAAHGPWYGGGDPGMNFINAAFLFHGPQRLQGGAMRTLAYRVAIHDGIWSATELETLR